MDNVFVFLVARSLFKTGGNDEAFVIDDVEIVLESAGVVAVTEALVGDNNGRIDFLGFSDENVVVEVTGAVVVDDVANGTSVDTEDPLDEVSADDSVVVVVAVTGAVFADGAINGAVDGSDDVCIDTALVVLSTRFLLESDGGNDTRDKEAFLFNVVGTVLRSAGAVVEAGVVTGDNNDRIDFLGFTDETAVSKVTGAVIVDDLTNGVVSGGIVVVKVSDGTIDGALDGIGDVCIDTALVVLFTGFFLVNGGGNETRDDEFFVFNGIEAVLVSTGFVFKVTEYVIGDNNDIFDFLGFSDGIVVIVVTVVVTGVDTVSGKIVGDVVAGVMGIPFEGANDV